MKNLTVLFTFLFAIQVAFASDNLKKDKLKDASVTLSHEVYFNTDKYALQSQEVQYYLRA